MSDLPLAARVVEVIADRGEGQQPRYRYGSGCLVAGRTVVTAAHVVFDATALMVRDTNKVMSEASLDPRFVGGSDGQQPDLALIEISGQAAEVPAMDLACVDRDSPSAEQLDCNVIGYPTFMERTAPDGTHIRETALLSGYVPVLSTLATGLLTVQVSAAPRPLPPERTALGESEWAGMSGAPVIADGYLVGVITEHSPRQGSATLTATPLTALQANPAHPTWGPGVANPGEWWARLGVADPDELPLLPARSTLRSRGQRSRRSAASVSQAAARPGQRDQVEWLSDTPATDDLLRRLPLARVLAARMRRFEDEEPGTSFLIHIDGPWGTGKSTLLNLLRRQLEQEPKWLTIHFNAWRQSRVGPAWWALLAALRKDVGRPHPIVVRGWFRLAESWVRFRRVGAPFALAFLLSLVLAAAVFLVLRPHSLTASSGVGVARGTTAILAAFGVLWAGSLVAARFLLWDSARGAKLFEESNGNPMNDVAQHFGWLIMKARHPVAFFIDDLDRCTGDYVIELLDTIQTLVRDSPKDPIVSKKPVHAVSFIIAADGAWIRRSYEIAYTDYASSVATPGRSLGYQYLDKLFQLRVPVPTIDEVKQEEYLRDLLRVRNPGISKSAQYAEEQAVLENLQQSSSEAEIVETLSKASPEIRSRIAGAAVEKLSMPDLAEATEHRLQRFATLLEPNPRAMKRFVNDYSILRAVRTLEGNAVQGDPLALWAVVETRWPALADYLRAQPYVIRLLTQPASGLESIPADIRQLFDDQSVQSLVNFECGGPLTPELIQACCGMTVSETGEDMTVSETGEDTVQENQS